MNNCCHLIDIGSNTVKMSVFKLTPEEKLPFVITHYTKYPAKLLSYSSNGHLTEEGIALLCSIVSRFTAEALARGSGTVYCLSTAVLRAAHNADEVIDRVKKATGVQIDLISGDEEAKCSYGGMQYSLAKAGLSAPSGYMIDMGGGSTEIIAFQDGKIIRGKSYPFGSLSLSGMFADNGVLHDEGANAAVRYVLEALSDQPGDIPAPTVCLIGGTAQALTALDAYFDGREYSHGTAVLSPEAFADLHERFFGPECLSDKETLEVLTRITPDRVTTVLPGLCAYHAILDRKLHPAALFVTDAGVREGYLLQKLGLLWRT